MPCMRCGLALLWSWACFCSFAQGEVALLLGDSWAAFAGNTLLEHCVGMTQVVNVGVPGTTAADWAAGLDCDSAPDSFCCQEGSGAGCSIPAALDMLPPGDEPVVAWVSLGGNDYIMSSCDETNEEGMATLQENLEQVIANISALAPEISVVVTGYATPSGPLVWAPGCEEPGSLHPLNEVVKIAAEATNITFVNVTTVTGGSLSSHSLPEYYLDEIHLNARGYCRLWTDPEMQDAMGCETRALRGPAC